MNEWKRRHTGWWENARTGAVISKGLDYWWLMPGKKGKVSRHKSLAAARKAVKEQGI